MIITKDRDNDNDDENNTQNKDNKKYLKNRVHVNDHSSQQQLQQQQIKQTKTKHLQGKRKQKQNKKTPTKQTIILFYYIPTMKRLPFLICSLNITFIKTKRGICL